MRKDVRETGVSRYHGGQTDATSEIPRKSQHVGTVMFKRGPNRDHIMPRGSRYEISQSGIDDMEQITANATAVIKQPQLQPRLSNNHNCIAKVELMTVFNNIIYIKCNIMD